ncbi:MAG TPA: BamA/TamA family outer membrane protein [Ignavibacteria bacterium]|nr:BamA/TamA family outer membrane protein [Ignavibacteria bacterium]
MIAYYSKYKVLILYLVLLLFAQNVYSQSDEQTVNNYEIDDINIVFKGIKTFSEDELKNILASSEGDVFDMLTYIQDGERIKKFYFDRGFFDAVVDTHLVYKKEDAEVDEYFYVREKTRYVYYDIKYKGLENVSEAVKNKIYDPNNVYLKSQNYYNKDTIKLEVARVLEVLFDNGYALASADKPFILKLESNEKELKGKVNIDVDFKPGGIYSYGKTQINIKGKRYNITESDIRRELTYREDQVYDKSQVVESEFNISKITLLDNPRINIDSIDSLTKKIDFVINAQVGNKYDLTPELFGYYIENYFYLGTGLKYSDKYFLGGGRVLTSSARIYFNSIENNRFEFLNTIYQPYLFNSRYIYGNWNIGIQYNIDEFSNNTEIKNSVGVTFELPKYTYINQISTNWDIINQRITLKNDIIVDDEVLLNAFSLNNFESLIGLSLVHNSVNDLRFPSAGYYQAYTIQESGLLGGLIKNLFNTASPSYLKLTSFNSGYKSMSKREKNVPAVIAGKLYTGIIFEYGDNNFFFQGYEIQGDLVPTDTRFVCGGSTSIRGWGAKQLGIVADKNVGGDFIIENSIEYRLRPFLSSSNVYLRDVGFTAFMDVGNVWSKIDKVKLNQFALASGVGLRYYSIVGAIRIDVGFKIYDPQPGPVGGSYWIIGPGCNFSDKYHLQFGIGNTF